MKNGVMMQFFEWNLPNDGVFWKQLKNEAKQLHQIGISAVWIPPAYKADEQQDEGYATYDLFDIGEFNQKGTIRTKYGTKEELKEAIHELHKYGISVYLDTVLNHKTGADFTEKFMAQEVDPSDRNKALEEPRQIQGWTGYNFPGRQGKYSDFVWHWHHFSGTEIDDSIRKMGIFRIVGENKYWSEAVDSENGNYDYLLGNDIDLKHPEVIAELNRWGIWVANELNLDGVRLDAIKHMDTNFVKQFLEAVRKERGDDYFAVGEYWKGDFDSLKNYLEALDYKIDLFDVPLHYKMYQASLEKEKFDFTQFLNNTLVTQYPESAVTFVDNHDSQQGSSLESQIEDWFKPSAYALILLAEKGYPCIFYGDYYGVNNTDSPHKTIIELLLSIRKKYAYGNQNDYFDHPNTVGFTRIGDKEHPDSGLALLISNSEDGEKLMSVGENHKGEIWHEITGCMPHKTVTIDEKGCATFYVQSSKLSVWVKKP